MLDQLYENIGSKLKNLAKGVFIVEALGAIITGITLLGEELLLPGLLTAVLGPIIAWISSWVLYAFGELVEKTVNNETNTKAMLHLMTKEQYKQNQAEKQETPARKMEEPIPAQPKQTEEPAVPKQPAQEGSWACPVCKRKNVMFRTTCWACGTEKE